MNAKNKAALRARLERAQAAIYGNARVNIFPALEPDGFPSFYDWLGDYASRNIEYISIDHMGLETRAIEGVAFPRYPYESRYSVLIRDGIGQVYSYGRMGKTFYPTAYAYENGTGFHLHNVSELNMADTTRAVQLLEQFNSYVAECADNAASCYEDEARQALQETANDLRDDIASARGAYKSLAQELRTLRGIDAPEACAVLHRRLKSLADVVRDCARDLRVTLETLA